MSFLLAKFACSNLEVKFCAVKYFFLHIPFTRVQTKYLQSTGTYISGRTWDPSQRVITK